MNTLLTKYKSVLFFILAVAVLYGGYQFFLAPPNEAALTVVTEGPVSGPDQELIALLLELRGISLDGVLFEDPVFRSLEDFGKELVSEPVGRINPFAPLGSSATR